MSDSSLSCCSTLLTWSKTLDTPRHGHFIQRDLITKVLLGQELHRGGERIMGHHDLFLGGTLNPQDPILVEAKSAHQGFSQVGGN